MSKTGGFNRTLKVTVGVVDILIYHLSFVISFLIRYKGTIPTFNYSAYQSVLPYIMIAFLIINIFSGIYILYNKKFVDMFSISLISQVMMSFFIMAMTFFGRWFAFPRTIVFINLIVSTLLLTLWRFIILEFYLKKSGTSRVMIVGSMDSCREAVRNFKSSKTRQYKVTSVAFNNYYENIVNNIDNIDVFYLLDFHSIEEENKMLSYLTVNNKRVFLGTNFGNILRINNRIMNIDDESLIAISKFEIAPENDAIKRMIDIVISLIMLIVTSPIMLIAAILIKITSRGPIFYKQIRITKGQKEFEILKFRSMRIDAEELSGPVLAQAEDPRVTKVGKYLRSLRIDELPQLFNVLKGDMSLIGPRPERPYFVDQFKEQNPYYYLRHTVRAGITGYAQVYGKYSTDFNSKLKFDLLYIKDYSLMMDIQILFQTVKILFDKVSSKGLEEELTNEEIFEDINIYE
ncbi:exopolysaccharide biosynthesis polyprenyl glycosylphosphotransferase [Atopostipes suicloacalis DSM 15692]|uniref:Exopolysaccharide biosynthesis polyprenyl glycosylphosphotransferase n=1 Tax=Atopostipes suicloacalis DSM 15692 TaxID=1121025 RepID=A0A1M4X307_9LACT|nr:sugar transferase [Atopostipes suicloacalis]SHE87787.1 exopolysaccharide biosynthesis polyprenyl glycosylphosphotransferase [Atopostipes suicloacalis DSM 15692]